ncbi:MAG: hypothetical protein GX272_11815 [Epulopiscium sp.]|nr:hypothetical protein [Candidatus Epulonipiscium sp.]
MKKHYLFNIVLLLLLSLMLLVGCQKKQEKSNTDSSESNSPPSALEDLQKLSEELIATVSKKDWAGGAEQIKSMHSKWNAFFADAQKKGMPTEKADEFNKDLNTLTTLIISKAMEDSKDKAALEYKKTALELERTMSKKSESSQGQSGGESSGGSDGSGGQSGGSGGQSGNSGQSSQSGHGGGSESSEKELKLPEEALPDSYPLMTATPDELEIAHAAVKLTKHIPYMTELFKTKLPSEILILKYHIRNIKISSKQGKWDEIKKDLEEIDEVWPRLQPKVMEKKDTLAIQFNQSVVELKDVVAQKDSTLTTIKCDIALENIKKISETLE